MTEEFKDQMQEATEKTPEEITETTIDQFNTLLSGLTKEECRILFSYYMDTTKQIQNGGQPDFEDVQRLMKARLADSRDSIALYSIIFYAMQAQQENEIAPLVNAALIAGIRSGKIQTGAQAQPYLDALAKILSLPDETTGTLQQIRADLETLETILDRHFETILPRIKEQAPEVWATVRREIEAATDVYHVYADKILEEFAEYDERRIYPYHR